MEYSDSFSSIENVSRDDETTSAVGDGAASSSESNEDQSIAKGGVTTPFPWKLHIMLDHMEAKGDDEIVSWQPHGRAFVVRKPKEFVAQIMPQFFNQTKYASFQRQLNLYGFSRLTHGPDKGAYYHSCFIRGERHLCRRMIRQKIKGTKVRKSLSPEEEPNFYNMTGAIPTIPSEEEVAMQLNQGKKQRKKSASSQVTPVTTKPVKRGTSRRRSSATSVNYPVVAQAPQPSGNKSYVMLTHTGQPLPGATRTVSPHASTATLSDSYQKVNQIPMVPMTPVQNLPPQPAARGGDLLFFEGQPFRYLEHIEVATKSPSQKTPSLAANPPRRSTSLQDMITTIVNHDPPQQLQAAPAQQVCSI